MSLGHAWVGEDVPIYITYTDDAGNAIDPDDQDADGTPDADITIVEEATDTEVVSAVAMTHNTTGEFEYVWDTAGAATGTYRVEATAEFGAETKISKRRIGLRTE